MISIDTHNLCANSQVLLTSGLRRLLAMAGREAGADGDAVAGAAEPWPRVHALNMLRLAFSERELALDGSAFLADGGAARFLHFPVLL